MERDGVILENDRLADQIQDRKELGPELKTPILMKSLITFRP